MTPTDAPSISASLPCPHPANDSRVFSLSKRVAGTYRFNNSHNQPDEVPPGMKLIIAFKRNYQHTRKISANATNQGRMMIAQTSPNIVVYILDRHL